jgi:hypothetical protein
MTEIYLDEHTCKQEGISYWEGHLEGEPSGQEVSLNVGSLMHWRRAWDSKHRRIFAAYVSAGESIRVKPTLGPGWFELTNYPLSNPHIKKAPVEPLDFRGVLRAD